MKQIATGNEEIATYCQMPIKPVEVANHLELPAKTDNKKYRPDNHATASSGMWRSRQQITSAGA